MSTAPQGHFHADRRMRRLLGPLFGTACLVATCTGVAVLAVLLGSVVAPRSRATPKTRGMRWVPTSQSSAAWSAVWRRLRNQPMPSSPATRSE